jgi:hypothetical protein
MKAVWTQVTVLAVAAMVGFAMPVGANAHSPDPVVGGALWAQDQEVPFGWRTGAIPPAKAREAILAAADDSNASRASKAASFVDGGGASKIGYGTGATCGVNGIACFNRGAAPDSFTMWFREQGHEFDWGTLSWCQLSDPAPNGCYDIENVALDEFGHVLILGHHDNFAGDSDYLDAVVQTFSRTKPKAGWNAHVYGRCDVATLQLKYDMRTWVAPYSTCLSIATTTTLSASRTSVPYGDSVTFTATLKTRSDDAYGKLKGNPLAARTIVIQRRPVGGTAWTTLATMPATSTAGSYRYTVAPGTSYEWRAVFPKPVVEGLLGSGSAVVTVTVSGCSSPPCPLSSDGFAQPGGSAP